MEQQLLEELIERSLYGENDAFRRIVESHQGYAFALAFRLVDDRELAGDVVQESFIRVWRHLRWYDPAIKFTTWLYRIVVNLSLDQLKMEKRRTRVFTGELNDMPSPNNTPEQEAVDRDLADRIRAAAARLSPRQRLVFVLRDLEDLSVKETAGVLAISCNAVKVHLSNARRNIRKQLENNDHVREG